MKLTCCENLNKVKAINKEHAQDSDGAGAKTKAELKPDAGAAAEAKADAPGIT